MQESSVKKDLLEGSVWKGILLFALPVFLSNLFQQFYNAVDSLIVGQTLGTDALAAVSSSGNLIFLFVGFFNGTAMGAGVLISRYFGSKDYENMQKAIHTDIALGLIFSVVLTAAGVLLTPTILTWMNTDEAYFDLAVSYFRVYFSGVAAPVLYNIAVGILHAVGDSRHPLYYLIFSSFLNVALDLLFVCVLRLGVGSAALATVLSQTLSAVLCFIRLIRYDTPYRVNVRKIRFYRGMVGKILHYGLPSGVQNSVIGFANVIVQSNINTFGEIATAGYGVYIKLEGFAFLPITCFSVALSTFIGQNLGAGQHARAKRGARFGILCSISLAEVIGLILYFAAPFFMALFVNDEDPEKVRQVIEIGVKQAHTEAFFYFLLAFAHCVAGIFRGAGKPVVPMVIMLGVWCVLRVGYIELMMLLMNKGVIPTDIVAIYWAYPLTWAISSVIFLIYLLASDWVHGFDRKKGHIA